MRKEEIAAILEKHLHWLREDVDGWETMRADLTGAYLTGADLRGADLTRADLTDADLTGADLTGADLTGADLRGADLRGADLTEAFLTGANLTKADLTEAFLTGANLTGADLTGADLTGADLTGADLTGADLTKADLTKADLRGADLTKADLTEADLTKADLRGANLTGANLTGANLTGAKINYPIACPEEGAFIAWKKAVMPVIKDQTFIQNCCAVPCIPYSTTKLVMESVIIKLLIPKDAKRSSATTRKCRASKAIVLEGYVLDDPKMKLGADDIICSVYSNDYTYKIGDTLEVSNFDENRWNECAPGIHFFITRKEAEEYML